MTDADDINERLRAVERALTDGDHDVAALAASADLLDRVERLETRVEALADRVDDLDASTQAVRGYVGNVRSVNDDVERRAEAALAAVEKLERRLDARDPDGSEPDGRSGATPDRQDDGHDHLDRREGDARGAQGRDEAAGEREGETEPRPADRAARRVVGTDGDRADRDGWDDRGRPRPSESAESGNGDGSRDDGLLADIRDAL